MRKREACAKRVNPTPTPTTTTSPSPSPTTSPSPSPSPTTSPSPSPTISPEPGEIIITGTVFTADGGVYAGATVSYLYSGVDKWVTTDASGKYIFKNVSSQFVNDPKFYVQAHTPGGAQGITKINPKPGINLCDIVLGTSKILEKNHAR